MKTARIFIISLSLVLGMFLVAAAVGQDVPQLINYQGYLIEDGQPYNGEVTITFSIYDDSTGDAPSLWSEAQPVRVNQGYYNVLLGSVTAFPDSLFVGAERYLGIKVGAEPEMTPRIRIASVGFALNADKVDGQDASAFLSTNNDYGRFNVATDLYEGMTKLSDKYVNEGQANSVTSAMIANGQVGTGDLANSAVTSEKVSNNSLQAIDIADEPGIARNSVSVGVTVANSGVTNITSCSITVPGSGFIVARAYGYGYVGGTSIGNIIAGIVTSSTATPTFPDFVVFGSNDEPLSSSQMRWGNLATERTFEITTGGTYTYYLNASRGFTGGSAKVWYAKLLLTYFPTNYGTVESVRGEVVKSVANNDGSGK